MSHVLDEGDEQLLSPAQRREAPAQLQGGLDRRGGCPDQCSGRPALPPLPPLRFSTPATMIVPWGFKNLQSLSPPLEMLTELSRSGIRETLCEWGRGHRSRTSLLPVWPEDFNLASPREGVGNAESQASPCTC